MGGDNGEIVEEQGTDGTWRRWSVSERRVCTETLCSYGPCGKWFIPKRGAKSRFHSDRCRGKAFRAEKAAQERAARESALTDDSRAPS